ncbi:hypothetical protein PFISCL1PPCAC_21063, partial [Pristionchus fissidentatus]
EIVVDRVKLRIGRIHSVRDRFECVINYVVMFIADVIRIGLELILCTVLDRIEIIRRIGISFRLVDKIGLGSFEERDGTIGLLNQLLPFLS